jgi:RNA polymerase sigma-70 factor (ECF subfamily)
MEKEIVAKQDNLEIILEAYRSKIFRYLCGLASDFGEAEELTQDTLFRAHEKFSDLSDPKKLMRWLYRIGTNLFLDRYRTRIATKNAASHTELWGDADLENFRDENAPQLQKVLECKEMSDCVNEYFSQISDDYRAVIFLHDVEGLTNREVAEVLGISVHTAKIRLHRARKRLQAILQDVCEFHLDERGVLVCDRKQLK